MFYTSQGGLFGISSINSTIAVSTWKIDVQHQQPSKVGKHKGFFQGVHKNDVCICIWIHRFLPEKATNTYKLHAKVL